MREGMTELTGVANLPALREKEVTLLKCKWHAAYIEPPISPKHTISLKPVPFPFLSLSFFEILINHR